MVDFELYRYRHVRSLRSQDNHLLAKPSVYTSIGRRTFSHVASQIWNAIPLNTRISPSVSSFKRNLKTHYFTAATGIYPCHVPPVTARRARLRFCQQTDIVCVTNVLYYIITKKTLTWWTITIWSTSVPSLTLNAYWSAAVWRTRTRKLPCWPAWDNSRLAWSDVMSP